MDFISAFYLLQKGVSVRRSHWTDDQYIKLVTFNGFKPTLVYYDECDDPMWGGKFPGYDMQWDDITATNWVVWVGDINKLNFADFHNTVNTIDYPKSYNLADVS